MTGYAQPPYITATDRFSLTLFFAVVLHTIVILGLSFDFKKPFKNDNIQKLEVTLVNKRSLEAPDNAQYLAQANYKGAGNTTEKVRASTTSKQSSAMVNPKSGMNTEKRLATTRKRSPQKSPRQLLMQRQSTYQVEAQPKPQKSVPRKKLTAKDIIRNSMEIASLDAQLQQQRQAYAKLPRVTYISANTREYKYAAYMDAWRNKVERIGVLNYPAEARRQRIVGAPVISVGINTDGSIKEIILEKSSGNKLIDAGAIHIIRISAPFSPLPKNISNNTDTLYITRTWIFKNGNQLVSK